MKRLDFRGPGVPLSLMIDYAPDLVDLAKETCTGEELTAIAKSAKRVWRDLSISDRLIVVDTLVEKAVELGHLENGVVQSILTVVTSATMEPTDVQRPSSDAPYHGLRNPAQGTHPRQA